MKKTIRRHIRRRSNQSSSKHVSGEARFENHAIVDSFVGPQPMAIQRKCEKCDEEASAQRKESSLSAVNTSTFSPVSSSGVSLPLPVKSFFETRMHHDFSEVKIHEGVQADRSAKSIRAKAYTLGRDIVFADGQFDPHSIEGKQLLAHELTHVVQQDKHCIQRMPETQEEEVGGISSSGRGTPVSVSVMGNGASQSLSLQGRTDATYDGGTFSTTNVRVRAGSNCTGCTGAECVSATGNVSSSFHVTTTVTLPSVADYPNLTACQRQRVSEAITNVLAPHEQEHVAAFNAYNGTVVTPFTFNGCRSDFDAYIDGIHQGLASSRQASAQAASDALDPFNFNVNLDCTN